MACRAAINRLVDDRSMVDGSAGNVGEIAYVGQSCAGRVLVHRSVLSVAQSTAIKSGTT
jgi:hypothetical protein